MIGDVTPYLGLVPATNADKGRFLSSLITSVQPLADAIALLNDLPGLFDTDAAVGSQLDIVGQWVGISRYVASPLTGVYFSFDTANLGFEQGVWIGPGDPTSGLTALPDDIYRILLKARIAANQWDGTVGGAYQAYNDLLEPYGYQILIQDNGNMTLTLALQADSINPTFQQLFKGSYLDLRPAGVAVSGYITPSVAGPFFGFDVENPVISGFDIGGWGIEN